MKNLRIWFKKQGSAKFISHLDMCRLMERAIHKAKLPFWYTEGFNPHVFLTINMPISLGYIGLKESMDVKLLDDDMEFSEIIEKMNSGLPLDVRVFEIRESIKKPGDISYSSYEICIESRDKLLETAKELMRSQSIIVTKKTKKGFKDIDIKPDFMDMEITQDGELTTFKTVLKSSNQGSINPRLFFEVLEEKLGEKLYPKISRTNCFDAQMKEFR